MSGPSVMPFDPYESRGHKKTTGGLSRSGCLWESGLDVSYWLGVPRAMSWWHIQPRHTQGPSAWKALKVTGFMLEVSTDKGPQGQA